LSWPDTVRWACLPKKSLSQSTPPAAVRGGLAASSVDTRNIWPAPSASDAVMIGVWIQKKPCSWKNRCTAIASVWRTRVTAPITLVRGRRCATSRRYSIVWRLGCIG
jgi:hypothetical protein